MNKPNQQDLEYLSKHMLGCRKREGWNVNAKRRVLIGADSNDAGKNMAKIFQSIYPNAEIKDNSGGYRDFSLQFDTVWRRDQAVTEINKMVSDYKTAHPGISTSTAEEESYTETLAENIQDGSSRTIGGTTVYLIIGAVAIVLILLIWNKKKK